MKYKAREPTMAPFLLLVFANIKNDPSNRNKAGLIHKMYKMFFSKGLGKNFQRKNIVTIPI